MSYDHLGCAPEANVAVTTRTDPDALQQYRTHWHLYDPWLCSPRTAPLRCGDVIIGDELIAPAEFRRTAFYNEFSRGFDIAQALAGMVEMGPDRVSCDLHDGPQNHPCE